MFATYQTVDYNSRVVLGNGIASAYATSVASDILGILTGTVTSAAQLSAYADKPSCLIQGAVGDWVVYDSDAHPAYPGTCKVLRRLCVDGISYQYLFIGFRMAATDYLNWVTLPIGGWNSVTKAPTMTMSSGTGLTLVAGEVVTTTNIPFNTAGSPSGTNNTRLFSPALSQALSPLAWRILSTPAVLAIWPESNPTAANFPITLLAEFQTMHPWNSSALGVSPLVYQSGFSWLAGIVPQMRNAVGTIVPPDYCTLFSTALKSPSGTNSYFYDTCDNLTTYTRDAVGAKAIPVIPIDIKTTLGSNGYYCYAGRVRALYATLSILNISDTFLIGTDTYVVIPTGNYSNVLTSYSLGAKLCAKVA